MSLSDFFSPEDFAAWVYILVTLVFSVLFFRRERQARVEQLRHLAAIEKQLAILLEKTAAEGPSVSSRAQGAAHQRNAQDESLPVSVLRG